MNPQARRRRGRSEQRQERPFAMRLYLLAFLALFGMNAMAADNWKAFPYDQSAYDYPGDKLKEAWPRLTRGFGDYP
ncbi:hypothetical protein Q6322_29450, partial [Klebsiella pneumoniae]|uniref:hypothetical protein n=1 Tax=Klebsiella pneumoniae TaxID=573 RepID=UPI0027308D49